MSLSASTKLWRGAASYTADTREALLPSSVVASKRLTSCRLASNNTALRGR